MKNYSKICRDGIGTLSVLFLLTPPLSEAAKLDLFEPQSIPYVEMHSNFPMFSQQNQLSSNTDIINLLKEKKLSQARGAIEQRIKNEPESAILYSLRGMMNTIDGELSHAEQDYQHAIALDSSNLEGYLGIAEIYLQQKKLKLAEIYFQKALAVNANAIGAYIGLASIASTLNDNDRVEKNLQLAHQKTVKNIDAKVMTMQLLSQWYKAQQQFKPYLTLAQEFRVDFPNEDKSFNYLLDALFLNGKAKNVEQELNAYLAKHSQDTKYRYKLIDLLVHLDSPYQSIDKVLQELEKITPNSSRPLSVKAQYFLAKQDYEKVLEIAGQAKSRFPQSILSEKLKGEAYQGLKELAKAQNAYEIVYRKQPKEVFLLALVDILEQQKKHTQATILLQTALKKTPDSFQLQLRLGQHYILVAQYPSAIKEYEKLLIVQPNSIVILNDLAWLYMQVNDKRALSLAEKAYKLAPKSFIILDTYGSILIKQGAATEAIEILSQAITLNNEVLVIQFHLAQAYVANGQQQAAIELLNGIVSKSWGLDGERNEARALLAQLKKN